MSNVDYITRVYLLNVPLENDYKHTLYFESKEDQYNYFSSRVVATFEKFSYQRKDNIIRIGDRDKNNLSTSYDDLLNLGVNYVIYQNVKYSSKWFYCFIKDLKYVNDGMTEIEIETDVLQTWMFNYNIKDSFIEREHVNDDTIGKHTFPEGLETGEYMCHEHTTDDGISELSTDLCYVLSSTVDPQNYTISNDIKKFTACGGGLYDGIYSGVAYFRFDNYVDLNNVLKELAGGGQSDAVNGLFLAPKKFAPLSSEGSYKISYTTTPRSYEVTCGKHTISINSYYPKNNKLFTYPFQYLLVSNNNGGSAVYRYEDFSNEEHCTFEVKGALTPGCSIRLTPTGYKNVLYHDEESLNLGKLPICNWTTDMYTNWMVQNSASIANQQAQTMTNGILGTLGSIATGDTGGIVSSITNTYFSVKSSIIEQEKQSLVPPQANGNVNCGDVITSSNKNTFHFYGMTIKKEFAERIDRYFDMYGYQINTLKKPNVNHRENYWFIKTLDINIDGAIPNNDMQKIKDCYNSGITFWKNPLKIQDYSVSNKIVE